MTTVTFWRHLFSLRIREYISAGWSIVGQRTQREAAHDEDEAIPKMSTQRFHFSILTFSGDQSALIRAEQCAVKYFLMGISVILVLWVGTFVMMVE
ncbi:membrane protein YpdK [Cedecea colo]|uniref:membrane protein YpdK n=1 Tax=Cedecea colo TaxID=2552946 RepID=UPI001911F01D|nr:membrane protein YpdK [Cedecea colo]